MKMRALQLKDGVTQQALQEEKLYHWLAFRYVALSWWLGQTVYCYGARRSSVVRAYAHGAMGRRIDPSWGGPTELFLIQPVIHD